MVTNFTLRLIVLNAKMSGRNSYIDIMDSCTSSPLHTLYSTIELTRMIRFRKARSIPRLLLSIHFRFRWNVRLLRHYRRYDTARPRRCHSGQHFRLCRFSRLAPFRYRCIDDGSELPAQFVSGYRQALPGECAGAGFDGRD